MIFLEYLFAPQWDSWEMKWINSSWRLLSHKLQEEETNLVTAWVFLQNQSIVVGEEVDF